MFRRSKSIYDQKFCLLPFDSVIVKKGDETIFEYVATKVETLRIRLDIS